MNVSRPHESTLDHVVSTKEVSYKPSTLEDIDHDLFVPPVVEVLVPLKLYEMTIKHRVLAELGELSHFILSVMSKHDLNICDIEEVTGLSEVQIRPVVDRLKALDLINDVSSDLSNNGKRIAYILENIHNRQTLLYIDQNYGARNIDWFIALKGSDCLVEISRDSITVPSPKRVSLSHVEDCFRQGQRFQSNHYEIIPSIIPEFHQLIEDSSRVWVQEWDVTFKSKASDKRMGIPVELTLKKSNGSEEKKKEKTLCLYTELLRLTVNFSFPLGVDFSEFENIKPITFVYSNNDQVVYDDIDFETKPDAVNLLYNEEECDEKENALNLLTHLSTFIDEGMQLYSRECVFDKGWQLHEYSYSEVINYIRGPNVLRIKS